MAEAVELYKQENHELSAMEERTFKNLDCFFKVAKANFNSMETPLDQLNFEEIKDLLDQFDCDYFVYIYFLMIHSLFKMFVKKHWIRSARALYECLIVCHESVKSGEKTVHNDEELKASLLVVQEFELLYDRKLYFGAVLDEYQKPDFAEIDQKTADIWKQLKGYKEIEDLPSEAKNFKGAEVIAKAMLKLHDQMEETHGKYKENFEIVKFLYRYLKRHVNFEPNTKPRARAIAYKSLTFYTDQPKMKVKLLKKANEFGREFGTSIPARDITSSL
jgi:hypothetical protein